jgi:hypothetical protein
MSTILRPVFVVALAALAVLAFWTTASAMVTYIRTKPDDAYYWQVFWMWTVPALLFLVAGSLSALEARRNAIASVLAASLFLDTSVNFIAQGYWLTSPASDIASNLGLFGIIVSVGLFPTGRIGDYGKWVLPLIALLLTLEVVMAMIWKQRGLEDEWARIAFWVLPACLALAVPILFAKWRETADGPERGQIDWMLSGVLLWLCSLLAAQFMASLTWLLEVELDESGGAVSTQGFMSLGFSSFAVCVIVSIAARNWTLGSTILKISASTSLILFGLVIAIALAQVLLDKIVAQAFGGDSGLVVKVVGAVLAACLIKPAHERAKQLVKRWSVPRESASATQLTAAPPI